ncbi:MAG: EAL domain-containing protein [Candidatus Thiodiazotropha endolucinida]|nr:EAL domain-containing protein [Candidatus Thiodiazotropha sp. (ex Lucina pensylvanica)]MBT3043016.1 EAL domain-containing protein [Candidatus Thiodiazotropha sp. (ex Codakia orbicularis)]MBT3049416.1 EAL domain-containing protein [Candidatus Thiodiazotropha sp. (ex Codakia orbicularis)]MBT3054483.1 EAL domain-containing protein [Candidatus Thiodiazotropha sp. (ex Codakia orbicularis)]
MNQSIPLVQSDESRLRIQLWVAFFGWTLLVLFLLLWAMSNEDAEMLELARREAIDNFNKDQAFRVWATTHGGVYVPVTERTQPSPLLRHIPERDLVTPSGRQLTLLNPAYMLRQMMEDYAELYGVKGRITSTKPLNPENAPDEWERAALESFERGEKEQFELTDINGEPYLRLIRPMETKAGCLKCHHNQGYQVGDIRGGVGISVPMKHYFSSAAEQKREIKAGLGLIWFAGVSAIWFYGRRSRQRFRERKDYEDQIWQQANFDSLTGLSNRNLFLDRLGRALAFARRQHSILALLFIDLDRFKYVNDALGHATGDQLLQEAARRLRLCVREMDTVSRLGGDEFTVILPIISEGQAVARVATSILTELSRPFDLGGQETHVSASIGITLYPQDGSDTGMLLQNADTAMYQAKAEGRNTYRFFTWEMNKVAEGRVSLGAALRNALRGNEFQLHYQPIVDIADGQIVGAEALIRWGSPEQGRVGPDQFIPVAEESGLIVPIGDWVLQQAALDLKLWDRAGLKMELLSVNVSTVQFQFEGFLEKMLDLMKHQPHLSSRLFLEITESVFLDEHREPGTRLGVLRKQGIGISIDDFGTGYSSLSYLKRFPVDKIKIDKSFIRDVTTDPEDAALCEAIIAMAHHLGLKVVAEGVETKAQWRFLHESGCDYAQGYYIGRPMAAATFTDFLVKHTDVPATG